MIITEEKTTNEKNISINEYRNLLQKEMIRQFIDSQTEHELELIKDATIRNAIKRNRKPEDVAWAILQ